ncbi:MAG: hypothetical protein ABIO40_12850 [Devosia sp.]
MDESAFDIAIFGSNVPARLLAAALCATHGKRVVLVGEPFSPLRLPAQLHLSVLPVTRPETWTLLAKAEAETIALLGGAGVATALVRTALGFRADLPQTIEALGHVRHLALTYGLEATFSRDGRQLTLGNAVSFAEEMLTPLVDAWLTRLGVVRLPGADTEFSILKNGSAVLTTGEQLVTAQQIALADDGALLARLSERERPALLRVGGATAVLTSAVRAASPPILNFLDRGTTLSRRNGGFLVHLEGESETEERLGACLADQPPLHRLATRRMRRVGTADGVPIIGWLKTPRLFVVAGLGSAAAFFAPALARLVAGVPTAEEKRWFAARSPNAASRAMVAEFVAGAA